MGHIRLPKNNLAYIVAIEYDIENENSNEDGEW